MTEFYEFLTEKKNFSVKEKWGNLKIKATFDNGFPTRYDIVGKISKEDINWFVDVEKVHPRSVTTDYRAVFHFGDSMGQGVHFNINSEGSVNYERDFDNSTIDAAVWEVNRSSRFNEEDLVSAFKYIRFNVIRIIVAEQIKKAVAVRYIKPGENDSELLRIYNNTSGMGKPQGEVIQIAAIGTTIYASVKKDNPEPNTFKFTITSMSMNKSRQVFGSGGGANTKAGINTEFRNTIKFNRDKAKAENK